MYIYYHLLRMGKAHTVVISQNKFNICKTEKYLGTFHLHSTAANIFCKVCEITLMSGLKQQLSNKYQHETYM